MNATIQERGNGFPDVGDVVAGDDGLPYRVLQRGGRIEGQANVCTGYVLEQIDWDDIADDAEIHESLALVAR